MLLFFAREIDKAKFHPFNPKLNFKLSTSHFQQKKRIMIFYFNGKLSRTAAYQVCINSLPVTSASDFHDNLLLCHFKQCFLNISIYFLLRVCHHWCNGAISCQKGAYADGRGVVSACKGAIMVEKGTLSYQKGAITGWRHIYIA